MSSDPKSAPDLKSAQDDLAYLRALMQPRDEGQTPFGESYLAGGLLYGLQLVGHYAQVVGLYPSAGLPVLILGVGPTVAFLAILTWIIWRHRKAPQGGVIGRAVGLMFGCMGLATLALMTLIGTVALSQKNFIIWLIYPCAVFILQGTAWLMVGALRRRPWMSVIGLAWFADAIAMGFVITTPLYMVAAAVGLFVLMAGSGAFMILQSRKSRAAAA